jgi:hypothetical protein
MATVIFTVPDTGTRFAVICCNRLGLKPSGFHTGAIDAIRDLTAPKLLITIRDPLLSFMSSCKRRNYRADHEALEMLDARVKDWVELEEAQSLYPFVTLQVDCPEDQRSIELDKVKDFLGEDFKARFDWPVVGSSDWVPTTMEMWKKIPWKQETKDKVEKALRPFREKYVYV